MKKNKIYPDSPSSHRKWFQIGFSLGLALFLFLIPLAVGRGLSLGSASLPYFSIPLGPALVYATGGLTITKSAPASVGQGQAITYTFRITNHTGQSLTAGTVLDNLPEEVDPSSCKDIQAPANWFFFCDSGAAAAGWSFVNGFSQPIPNGSAITLQFVVTATSPLTNGHVIVNDDYRVDANGFSDIGAPVTTTIQAPSWAITKTVSSATIKPGQNLVYTITATNLGQVSTSGPYTISDTLPNDVTLLSPISLTWTFNTPLAPAATRSVNYTVQVNSPLPNGHQIINDGYTVSGGGATGTATNQPVTVTVISTSTLSISKIASPNPVRVGQPLRYTITLTNNVSTGSADGVVITDILPPEVTFQSASPAGFTHSSGTVVWNALGSIPPNGSIQVAITGSVTTILPNPPRITNTFQASANNANPVAGFMGVTVEPDPPANVGLVLVPSSLSICQTAVATATVTDQHGNPVSGVSTRFFPPTQLEALSPVIGPTNANGQFVAQFRGQTPGSSDLVATAGALASPLAPVTVSTSVIPASLSLTATPNPLATGGNTAVVTATLQDCRNLPVSGQNINFSLSNPALATFSGPTSGTTNASGVVTTSLTSNAIAGTLTLTGTGGGLTATTSLNILPPNTPLLTLTKSATPTSGGNVDTGQTLVYTVRVANNGTGAATNLVITDDLASGLQFQSGNITSGAGPSVSGDIVTFSLANLAINTSTTATISVTVTSTVSGTILSNRATAKGNNTTLVTSNIVTHTVRNTASTQNIYLPIIFNQ
jgi:uncharacterized repeat protein (TIGR01451 family)